MPAGLLDNLQIDILQFEYGGTYIDAGITLKEVIKFLSRKGYRSFKIIPDGLINITEWKDEFENYQYANYCAVSPIVAQKFEVVVFQNENTTLKTSNMKLHLGCGERYLEGYINIDYPPEQHTVQQNTKVDHYADITKLNYPENSIDEVRLHHVFEHFDRATALALLCNWHTWLKPGGKLLIETRTLKEA